MPFAQEAPFNNINGSLVNIDNSHYSGSAFSSRTIPSTVNPAVLPEPLNNRQAANSYIPGCTTGGGKRGKKEKFKNISNMYKMNKTKKRSLFAKLKRKFSFKKKPKTKSKSKSSRRSKKSRSKKGGYSQYQSNVPMTQTYNTGGLLSPYESAMANPAPYHVLSNCTNCVDNYNHYTNKGFPSLGSY